MEPSHTTKERPRGFLDALASRFGIFAAVGFLVVVCVGAGLYTQSVVTQLGNTHKIFEDRQIRNGYVAMSDVQRLLLVAQKGVFAGGMTPELKAEFLAATDILYVRTDHLKRIIAKGNSMLEHETSLRELARIIEIADDAVAADFNDLNQTTAQLLAVSEQARSQLVQFLDQMRRHADDVMNKQSAVVSKQQAAVLFSLGALTIAGCVALLLLRLEIIGRRAREKAEQRVQFLAFFDPLTQLPNRIQFQDRVQAMLEDGNAPLAFLSIDLDDFKTINDTFGHAAGDAVLKRMGRILNEEAGKYKGFSARLAGDEFAMVVPGDDRRELQDLCKAILRAAAQPFDVEGETLEFAVSIGVATTTQVGRRMSATVDGLSRVSDFALYTSKSEGRNRFTLYDQTLEARFLERRAMLEELPRAIQEGDLEVFFQPKVSLPEGRVYGFEALVRWQRAGKIVTPNEFILLAEESGLVVEIDNFVLNEATRLLAQCNERNDTDFSVSVNLSTLHFNSSRIVQWVKHVLWRTDIRPDLLTLEITESIEMRDWYHARSIIKDLRKLGCKIAIDDFGTGFSSLAYLRSMVADELKIDRSLVDELEQSEQARLMLGSVFEIAQNLNLDITVEGVETPQQARIVYEMGARQAQGYLFGRPQPYADAINSALSAEPKFDIADAG